MVFYIIYTGQTTLLLQNQQKLAGSRSAYALAAAINYVHLAGPGASYNFTLSNIAQTENITISDVAVESARPQSVVDAPVLDTEVNTTSVKGGELVIGNDEGVITIAQ